MQSLNLKIAFDWRAWLGWILATLVGIELSVLCFYHAVFYAISNNFHAEIVFLAALSGAGTFLGAAQGFWLRKRMNVGLWWIAATVGGWYLAGGFDFLSAMVVGRLLGGTNPKTEALFDTLFGLVIEILLFCLLSILVSLPQWLLLRRYVHSSGWWLAIRPISWLAGGSLSFLAEYLNIIRTGWWWEPDQIFWFQVPELVGWSARLLTFGLGFAAVNGAGMVLLQSRRRIPLIEPAP